MQYHERIEQLDHHLNQIIYLLKQPGKNRFSVLNPLNLSKNYLYEKTWTLVIGTPNSGKTAFLQQAELNVIQGQTEDNADCSTWFSQEGVFIELPSVSLENVDENGNIEHFIQAIKARRRKKPFDNILLMINMYSFIQEYDRYMLYLESLKEQLQKTLTPHLSEKVNLYIVFTHMDKVAGFCDFFAEFSTQHTTHALGYLFDDYYSKPKLLEQHEKKYDRLLGRLHENLVTLLHKTRNNLTRYLIREFPQQLDSLRNMIRSSISVASEINESKLKIKGVFFTSACQSGVCIDRISIPVSQSYHLTLSNHFPQAHRTHPYFIRGIIKTISKDHYPDDTRFARYRQEHKLLAYTGYIVAGILLLGIGLGYYFTVQHINVAKSALYEYQKLSKEESLNSMIPELNRLAKARNSLNDMNNWFIPFQNIKKTKIWVNTEYSKELSQQFLPQIAYQLEKQLLNERNPALQYELLKAYLMLGEPQYLDMPFLKNCLRRYLHLSSSTDLESSLLQPFPGIELNQGIIDQVRNNLSILPPQYLMYMLIKNIPYESVPIKNDTFTLSASLKGIPPFYTRRGFEPHYTQTIPINITKILNERWILEINSSHTPESDFIHQVQELYIGDYVNWWQLFVYHVQPKSFNNYNEAIVYFDHLTEKKSPLTQMLSLIQSNTHAFEHPNVTQKIFNTRIAQPLVTFNTISLDTVLSKQTSALFNELHRYFTMTVNHKDKSLIAFNTVKQKFSQTNQKGTLNQLMQLAQTTAQPVKQWLDQIVTNTWMIILAEAKDYVNQQWQTIILPEYSQNIIDRFPIKISAEQDISLEDFSHFFNRQGTLARFFEIYLKPFLNTETAQWTPKKVDGFDFSLQPEIIVEFERANVIREMFFPNNTTTTLSSSFAMQPMELQPIIARVILDINGQNIVASQNTKNTVYFTWPGANYSSIPVTLTIQNITGEQFHVTEYGPWGFFRLLTHANIQPVPSDPKTLQLIFDLNGNGVQYLLRASSPLNPFIPDILPAFKLPETITA